MSETEATDPRAALDRAIAQCEADIAYYEASDDSMSMGRVIGAREVLHAIRTPS